ncbi:CatB-related O-acetyltransferase [Staphylococcus canis]|uniref:CatB-related O-acetyltransferase n=1 Tax=Staphylococcus canis TaxID=2724942 RepID=A0ABS0TA48_9STAP|nr:CatB-related O-acetyltransferase [Staphylococcus canis]MBI5975588.1 CatB-related O-acetyltransferase [Staphylococcus canis]
MINKVLKVLKNGSSKEKNIRINRLAYISNCHFEGHNYVDRFCKIRNSHFGQYSYVGFGSEFNHVEIGNYCSISSNVKIGLGKHPTHFFSTSPVFYSNQNPFGIKMKYKHYDDAPNLTRIGHDVWIGANVLIMDGVKIGNGAIVAAGSVVTKDVGDFEIVGGVPAKLIRKRFEQEQIKQLNHDKWWNESIEALKKKKYDFR